MLKWIKKKLDEIAKVNEETFKGERMDCCTMNKNNNPGVKRK